MTCNERTLYVFDEVTSTMDKAKEILNATPNIGKFAVLAKSQSSGRGTRGRTWTSPQDNMHLTVAFRLCDISVPLTLMPLRLGTLVSASISNMVPIPEAVKLKWPNDILIEDKKVCGILIEIDGDYIIVGIGCNVFRAPSVEESGSDAGRESTCVWDHAGNVRQDIRLHLEQKNSIIHTLGLHIYTSISQWVDDKSDSADLIVSDFQKQMTNIPHRVRQANGHVHEGTEVIPLRINSDGSLEVREVISGRIDSLYADYIW